MCLSVNCLLYCCEVLPHCEGGWDWHKRPCFPSLRLRSKLDQSARSASCTLSKLDGVLAVFFFFVKRTSRRPFPRHSRWRCMRWEPLL